MVTSPVTLNLDTVHLTDEQFYQLYQNNRDFQFERNAKGNVKCEIFPQNYRLKTHYPDLA